MTLPPRNIGTYDQGHAGPLVIVLGGMHGNEPAGVQALQTVFEMLALEPIHNRSFRFRGRLVGLRGNRRALARGQRFLDRDLNRAWRPDRVEHIRQQPKDGLVNEAAEQKELMQCIEEEIARYRPTQAVLFDLHTTTADGGIFSLTTDDLPSLELATSLHAPVVKGLVRGIEGTILHYFTEAVTGCPTRGVAFEAGQHDDPLSAKRAVAAIINLLRGCECVRPADVETKHDELLQRYSFGLPTVTELIRVHRIGVEDQFVMEAGFQNFQFIRKGDVLARDRRGSIRAEADGYILMPLYQPQGEDGFFLIKSVEL